MRFFFKRTSTGTVIMESLVRVGHVVEQLGRQRGYTTMQGFMFILAVCLKIRDHIY